MRFWFEHSSEVSLREQVVTQVKLGILCGELAPGERLPSIRELARRFGLHANTVSSGYQQLESEGWVESRKGSGVYVRSARPNSGRPRTAEDGLDRLVVNLFEGARRLGIPQTALIERVTSWAVRGSAERILLVEPDPELRRIVIAEIAEAVQIPVAGCDFGETAEWRAGALVVTLPSKLERVKTELRDSNARVHPLRIRSVPSSLVEHLPGPDARAGMLIGVASHWPEFLRFARTMLVAAGFEADALIMRDARDSGWRQGLGQASVVVCDAVTASGLVGSRIIVMRVLADGVVEELSTLYSSI